MQTDSSNDAVSNETLTCIPATEISSVLDGDDTIGSSCASDESAAMALLSLKKDSKKKLLFQVNFQKSRYFDFDILPWKIL